MRRDDVQKLVNKLDAKMSPRSVRSVYRTLRSMFRTAHVLDHKIPVSPCVKIVLPELSDKKVEALTPQQVQDLSANMPPRWAATVVLSAGTGLRISEIMGLTWDRIDLEGGTVTVDRQMTPKRRLGPPKSRKSIRVVPLPTAVADALQRHRELCPRSNRT